MTISNFSSKSAACLALFILGIGTAIRPVSAQVRVSPTPVSANLSQIQEDQAKDEQVAQATATQTPSITPTEDLNVSFELLSGLGTVAIHGLPNFDDGDGVGSLELGKRYTVTGRYIEWLQFQYDTSPTGFGWVHQSYVTLINDGPVPEINPFITPTVTPLGAEKILTREAITLTPGAVETLDAQARLITPGAIATQESDEFEILPTFTQPAEVARGAPSAPQASEANTFEETLSRAANGQLPPLVPILALAAAGVLGMILSLWRR